MQSDPEQPINRIGSDPMREAAVDEADAPASEREAEERLLEEEPAEGRLEDRLSGEEGGVAPRGRPPEGSPS